MRLEPSTQSASAPGFVDSPADVAPARRSSLRRRLAWVGSALVLLLLLVFTPPLVNANRYRIRIADTMSASLGRPVHLDSVSFHFLPMPGFTLSNLVVSEDPAFGAEPTIRANSVEATLRLSSLWHRPVEFSTVRFVDPSVNLVRNAEGRWNLSDILLRASHANTAPTAQRHAGPAPRFPYIEATGARVNFKRAEEKLPFSLTDADFALWLPSAQQWRVRLVGQPARTDANITDPGTVRIEGSLRRADHAEDIPVAFQASWHDAPLGEASRIATGADRGWRGTLNLEAKLAGTLGEAHLTTQLTLGGLRRAEFFPTHPLDLQIRCSSGFGLRPLLLRALTCTLPDDAPQPLTLQAAEVDPLQVRTATARVQAEAVPTRWALLWAALFSARVPTDLHPTGTLDADVAYGQTVALPPLIPTRSRHGRRARGRGILPALPATMPDYGWSGNLKVNLPGALANAPSTGDVLNWRVLPDPDSLWPALVLPAQPVRLGPVALVNLSAALTVSGYTWSVNGNASPAALLLPARYLPQLEDGLETVLPFPPTSTEPSHEAFHCTRSWSTAQSCSGATLTPAGTHGSVPD